VTNLKGNFAGFINRMGLYRVWVPLRDDGKGPLISIWIDPAMAVFQPDARKYPETVSSIGEEKDAERIDEYPLRRSGSCASLSSTPRCPVATSDKTMLGRNRLAALLITLGCRSVGPMSAENHRNRKRPRTQLFPARPSRPSIRRQGQTDDK
jgi:hypothetical protein